MWEWIDSVLSFNRCKGSSGNYPYWGVRHHLKRVTCVMFFGNATGSHVVYIAEGFNMVEQPLYFVKQEKWKTLSVLIESLSDGMRVVEKEKNK